jgi:hypothetical protein
VNPPGNVSHERLPGNPRPSGSGRRSTGHGRAPGRPASSLPAEVAGALAERAGVELAAGGNDSESAGNRRSGLGALLGYGVGLGVGGAYGLLRSRLPGQLRPRAAAAGLGLAAMAASDLPATALGVTDPRTWGAAGWVSDLLPHLAYGLATATVYEALADRTLQ